MGKAKGYKRKYNPLGNLGSWGSWPKKRKKTEENGNQGESALETDDKENHSPSSAEASTEVRMLDKSESRLSVETVREPHITSIPTWPTFSTALDPSLVECASQSTYGMHQLPDDTLFEERNTFHVPPPILPCQPARPLSSLRATMEDVEDEDTHFISCMGPPIRRPNAFIEAVDESAHIGDPLHHVSESDGAQSTSQSEGDSLFDNEEEGPDEDRPDISMGQIDDSDDEAALPQPTKPAQGYKQPPTIDQLTSALIDLEKLLRPPRRHARQRYKDPDLDKKSIKRLEAMKLLCFNVLEAERTKTADTKVRPWTAASMLTARMLGHVKAGSKHPGKRKAEQLRRWLRDFIDDREEVPTCNWQTSGRSLIDDEDFAQEIHAHLSTLGPFFAAEDICRFIGTPEMLSRLGRKRTISITTARRWLKKMGFRWTRTPTGQYVDGHKREDVVKYRNHTFLPAMAELEKRTRKYGAGDDGTSPDPTARRVVIWYHDESVFYAHDRRKLRWVHKSESAKPYAKGEGHSLMVADFVSADYGWLRSPDGKESARVLFKPGKNRDGYFDNKSIRDQAARAMEILRRHYPDEDHVLVFDNATTHLKRAEDALSASRMPKGPSANFMVEVNDVGADGKLQYTPDGKLLKKKIRMGNAKLPNGEDQPLYFPDDPSHAHAGQFKGMAVILQERGFVNEAKLKARCGTKMSDCSRTTVSCCCRKFLYNQPDFVNVESILEAEAREQGFRVLFLPKFHCELNFIEQCWGSSKRAYRLLPASSNEADLEKNVIECLDGVSLISMRRFATRSLRFMDAYRRNLNGAQAAWAAKKYRGHRTIPESILAELEKAGLGSPQSQ